MSYWALGYASGIRVRWYTPLLCRFFGELFVDPRNGVRIYTFGGVSLLIIPKKGGAA